MNLKNIKLLALDVDGTLTNGLIYLSENGDEIKAFNVKDGLGIKLLHQKGIIPAIITGRTSSIVQRRAKELSIKEVYQNISDKDIVLKELADKYDLAMAQVAFMGDDLNDLSAIRLAGISFAPSDCAAELKPYIDIIVGHKGGDGAVRDAIMMILDQLPDDEDLNVKITN